MRTECGRRRLLDRAAPKYKLECFLPPHIEAPVPIADGHMKVNVTAQEGSLLRGRGIRCDWLRASLLAPFHPTPQRSDRNQRFSVRARQDLERGYSLHGIPYLYARMASWRKPLRKPQ